MIGEDERVVFFVFGKRRVLEYLLVEDVKVG